MPIAGADGPVIPPVLATSTTRAHAKYLKYGCRIANFAIFQLTFQDLKILGIRFIRGHRWNPFRSKKRRGLRRVAWKMAFLRKRYRNGQRRLYLAFVCWPQAMAALVMAQAAFLQTIADEPGTSWLFPVARAAIVCWGLSVFYKRARRAGRLWTLHVRRLAKAGNTS